ncbi:uncharacterized protein DUF1761 [Novosphingobium kunmingense]|uniref:Uncharacterized protein DUF1761 n=1 Tax=Novosphingobium kunmingense TaxID=1211806 RepID=A0A2N0HKE5_9SPHN|nr:DUF1761 domain-containing protein [Novosphingobium kunmingense]PKB19426.1 uncharacterized protein DUF1761 [Novosphingobium kunmingense]
MGPVNWLAVGLGTVVFFLVGAVWYGALFAVPWQREVGVGEAPRGSAVVRVMGLTLLCEFLVVSTLGHLFARTQPAPHVVMMMALGFALTVMAPSLGINYLHQRKSLNLFLIDAGHFVVGMAAVGAVFILLG